MGDRKETSLWFMIFGGVALFIILLRRFIAFLIHWLGVESSALNSMAKTLAVKTIAVQIRPGACSAILLSVLQLTQCLQKRHHLPTLLLTTIISNRLTENLIHSSTFLGKMNIYSRSPSLLTQPTCRVTAQNMSKKVKLKMEPFVPKQLSPRARAIALVREPKEEAKNDKVPSWLVKK
jgi:hypothetical protein